MPTPPTPEYQHPNPSSFHGEANGAAAAMEDPEAIVPAVAHLLEQLHASMSLPLESQNIMEKLLAITGSQKEARIAIVSHSQAMPLFVSVLRNGTPTARINAASILSSLCKEEEMRLKVLLGGGVPPLLALLKSNSLEARKAAAEAIFEVSSGGLSEDHIGMKIFVTEGVVPSLWELLNPGMKQDKVVEGYVTGALRNLCGDKDGYWRATLESGGLEIITALLSSDNTSSRANAASLLARLILAFGDSVPKVVDAGAVEALLRLLGRDNNISVRASSADALEALSSKSVLTKKAVVDACGIPALIKAIVAPSKECMKSENGHALQRHAVCALANLCGGMSSLILYLGELSQSSRSGVPVSDIIGALAYSLMVFEDKEPGFDVTRIESILITLLKPQNNKLVQDCLLEALASLYVNPWLSRMLDHANVKRVLIGLISMASADVQEQLILSLTCLCSDGIGIWEALGKREGIQLLISLLGLSSEQHQEYAVALLSILTDQVDDSNWAITAAGGIPPLVQLLETGSQKAKEDAAHVLWRLCCHSDDIRTCVDSAGAVPSLLWLLKCGGPVGQEASSKALRKLIRKADSATINQLLALVLSDSLSSKCHAINMLGHVLTVASHKDLVQKGAPANKGLRSLIEVLNSSDEEVQECAASVLADLFHSCQDICESLATDEIVHSCMKLLTSKTQVVATQSARALYALSLPKKANTTNKMSYIAEGDVKPLIKLARTSSADAAETAVAALANLLSDTQIAEEALEEDVVPALTKVLGEGTLEGKKNASRALVQLLLQFPVGDVLAESSLCHFVVLALMDTLASMDIEGNDSLDSLDALALLSKASVDFTSAAWTLVAQKPESLTPLIRCLSTGLPATQDKAITILSRLHRDHPDYLGNCLIERSESIISLFERIIDSLRSEVRTGAMSLLVCATKKHRHEVAKVLDASGLLNKLVFALVEMLKQSSKSLSLQTLAHSYGRTKERNVHLEGFVDYASDNEAVLEGTSALWLLSTISSALIKSRHIVKEAGGVEVLFDKLSRYASTSQAEFDESEDLWKSILLLAILFQDSEIVKSPYAIKIVPLLAFFMKADQGSSRYLAAQAMASLVCSRSEVLCLAVANSGAIGNLVNLVGQAEDDIADLLALSEEFDLPRHPDQVVLEHLFDIEDLRVGATARNFIPLLVDLLRPMPDRPGAPPFSVRLLMQLAVGSEENKVVMAESGTIDALTKYLSLGPQDPTETVLTDLLGILYSNPDLLYHDTSFSTLSQLIAVLRLGSRQARLSAARALQELFNAENIRDSDMARQVVQPLTDMLNGGSEKEQLAAVVALIKLTSRSAPKALTLIDVDGNTLESLYKILSSSSSLDLKKNAAQLCYVLFGNPNLRGLDIALDFVQPLISLIKSDSIEAVEQGLCALDRLLDEEHHADAAAAQDVIDRLVSFLSSSNYELSEASISSLIKLGKDRPHCKLDMVSLGVIDRALEILSVAPNSVCTSVAELLRILTNNSSIAKSSEAVKIVEPLFLLLKRAGFTMWGHHSTLQALVNILEKPQSLKTLKLSPSQAIETLIPFLESPSQAIQQLGTELLSHLLEQEHFQQDITTKNAVVPLVQLAGIGILALQQTAIKALESISISWPKAVADAGGILEVSKIIIQDDPQPNHTLWESAALVLTNILRFNSDYYFKISIVVLVRLLHSQEENTVTVALNALLVREKDGSSALLMAESGAIEVLLELLRSHQCEESCGRLIESLFNNARVREMKVSKYAIAPLSQYLLDPQTRSQSARFLATLALGDLFQHEGLARSGDAVSACRALVSLLEDQPTEEMKTVALCALQSLVIHSRTNRRAVAEAGGILVIQELVLSPNADVAGQAALLVRYLFSNHTLQEYVSNELIRSLTAALERELWSTSIINEEVLRTMHVIFSNFKKLRTSEAATLCIPHLVSALKTGNEAAQDSVLDTLCLLKESWSSMNEDIAKAQALIASEAIPILQLLMKTCPPSFHDRADSLLHCLPGCLTVTIKRGNNLKQTMGSTNAFCKLTIGNGPPRQTKVVSHSTCPEWKEGFTWAFDVPPKGQKLYILCKSKSTFGKTTLGRVTIQIDKVVTEGIYSGFFSLNHDNNRDGASRTLEIEIVWSNRMSNECD